MKFGISLGRTHSSLWPKLTRRADELGFEPKPCLAQIRPHVRLGGTFEARTYAEQRYPG